MIGGIAVFAVTEWLGPAMYHLGQRIFFGEQHGLSIDVDEPVASSTEGWVFGGKAYGDLVPPPNQVEHENLESWATENGGTTVKQTLSFTLRGKSDKPVDVTWLEPKADCDPNSTAGVYVWDPTHYSRIPQSYTYFVADAEPLKVVFMDANGKEVKSPKYQVKEDDKESVSLSVSATSHRCIWSIVVHWRMDGKDHESRISDSGRYIVTGTDAATQTRRTDGR